MLALPGMGIGKPVGGPVGMTLAADVVGSKKAFARLATNLISLCSTSGFLTQALSSCQRYRDFVRSDWINMDKP